ncbi:uridine kinase [Striga asiatica]|uniref:Uridine kinase n=1 Tax=Striga asiatica TaxID=4170 RepID=A0A5A7QAP6_STRAF|nr:uridine kinase [Striga asiatica]
MGLIEHLYSGHKPNAFAEQLETSSESPFAFPCTILVLRKLGSGKSSTLNSILNGPVFEAGPGGNHWSYKQCTHVMPCFCVYPQEEKVSKNVTNESSKASFLSVQKFYHTSKDQLNGEPYKEEKYEYDNALSADRTYLKFKKRMDSYPEQCFR